MSDIPPEWQCPRFGVKAFHHPDLTEGLTALDPAIQLLELIDQSSLWPVCEDDWVGTASELTQKLVTNEATRFMAQKTPELAWCMRRAVDPVGRG